MNLLMLRVCKRCGIEKSIDNFRQHKRNPLWYGYSCKGCLKIRATNYAKKRKELRVNSGFYLNKSLIFYCKCCGQNKSCLEFNSDISSYRGYELFCRNCKEQKRLARLEKLKIENPQEYQRRKNREREYGKNHPQSPEKTREYRARAIAKDPNKLKNNCKKWRQNNPDKKRLYNAQWQKNMLKTNPQYAIAYKTRNRIRRALKTLDIKKTNASKELLGCSYEFLKDYIINQFTDGMTWEKLSEGEIELDHSVPCAIFNLVDVEEQKVCFHYSNLKPLWEADHIAKTINDNALIKQAKQLRKEGLSTKQIISTLYPHITLPTIV